MATKASMNPKDAPQSSLSFGEGWGRIISAKAAVHQLPPNKESGQQEDAAVKVFIEIQHTDEKGNPTGAEPIIEYFKAAGVGKDGSFTITPGKAKSRTDATPKDMGSEIGTEGNCLVGGTPHANSKFMCFMASVAARGFKQEILNEGYLPDLEGMLAYFVTEKKPGVNGGKPYDQLLVKEIKEYPYEATTSKPSSTSPSKGTTAAAKSKEAAPKAEVSDPAEVALEVLKQVASKNAGVKVPLDKMSSKTFTAFSKYSKEIKDAAKPLTQSAVWLSQVSVEKELCWEVVDVSMTFPE